jgi:acid phosphatase (class B)
MGGIAKELKDKAEKTWSTTKRLLALLSVWGLVFSLVTVTHLGVAFDYDDTLVNSAAAYGKAYASGNVAYSPQFWAVVNNAYDLEKPKLLTYPLAWLFRVFGFRVAVITGRPAIDNDALKKEWRHLVPRGSFFFGAEGATKHQHLQSGNYVIFFGDSDTDVEEARKAHVLAVRVRRHPKSISKDDYHPGTFGEVVLPLSEY